MSITEEPGTSAEVVPALTFKERLAARRKELESDAAFELEVPGYEGLWARYRILGYDEVRSIGLRVENETNDQVEGERLTAAATLVEACIELLEFKGLDAQKKPIFESTGYKWTAAAARDLFGVPLPDGVASRDAVMAIFPYPRDLLMMTHFQEFIAEGMQYLPEIEEVLQGELRGRSAGTTWGSSPQRP